MMQKPLLSICIPTYNRSQYLKKSIGSIVSQEEFVNGKVEVVISDNASEDDTKKVALEYVDKYENVKYHRNSENVRDKNFLIVLSLANGILRRLCNDTLIFEKGSLRYICEVIEKNKEDRPFLFWANGNSKDKAEIQNVDFRNFVLQASYWLTSIACFSIWDTECDGIKDDTEGCELLLWQVRKELELAYTKNTVVICNKVLTTTQGVAKKNISYGLYKVFYQNYMRLLNPYEEKGSLSRDDTEYLEKDLLFNFFTNWIIRWEINVSNLQYSETENLKKAVFEQYEQKPYWNEYLKYYRKKALIPKVKATVKKFWEGDRNWIFRISRM